MMRAQLMTGRRPTHSRITRCVRQALLFGVKSSYCALTVEYLSRYLCAFVRARGSGECIHLYIEGIIEGGFL